MHRRDTSHHPGGPGIGIGHSTLSGDRSGAKLHRDDWKGYAVSRGFLRSGLATRNIEDRFMEPELDNRIALESPPVCNMRISGAKVAALLLALLLVRLEAARFHFICRQ